MKHHCCLLSSLLLVLSLLTGCSRIIAPQFRIQAIPLSGPAPLAVQFSCTTSGNTAGWVYRWEFGDGQISALAAPGHTYNVAGNYTTTLTVQSNSARNSQSLVILVHPPVLEVTGSVIPGTGPVPLTVAFTAAVQNQSGPCSFKWNFGDGVTSSEQSPVHTYIQAGMIQAVVTATCEGVSVKDELSVTVEPLRPIVYILPSSLCSPYWSNRYGDRIFFYVHDDLKSQPYHDAIESDFAILKSVYNTVILVLPADDTARYLGNLETIDALAAAHDLWVLWAVFPNEKYGREESYLTPGTPMNRLVTGTLQAMNALPRTWKTAVWYGWPGRTNPRDITAFRSRLTALSAERYAPWFDEEYGPLMGGLAPLVEKNMLVITEWYQLRGLKALCGLFPLQLVVTGYWGARDGTDWYNHMEPLVALVKNARKLLGIWIFYDHNDGAGEEIGVYFPGKSHPLGNPWPD